jgi:hypothetical protein
MFSLGVGRTSFTQTAQKREAPSPLERLPHTLPRTHASNFW